MWHKTSAPFIRRTNQKGWFSVDAEFNSYVTIVKISFTASNKIKWVHKIGRNMLSIFWSTKVCYTISDLRELSHSCDTNTLTYLITTPPPLKHIVNQSHVWQTSISPPLQPICQTCVAELVMYVCDMSNIYVISHICVQVLDLPSFIKTWGTAVRLKLCKGPAWQIRDVCVCVRERKECERNEGILNNLCVWEFANPHYNKVYLWGACKHYFAFVASTWKSKCGFLLKYCRRNTLKSGHILSNNPNKLG